MTTAKVEAFLPGQLLADGVCVPFYRRPDGTILTQETSVGLAL